MFVSAALVLRFQLDPRRLVATYLQRKRSAPMKTITSREANQDFRRAKREARSAPVIVTERGRPADVLLSYEKHWRLIGRRTRRTNIVDALQMPGQEEIEFEPPLRQKASWETTVWSHR